MILSAAGRHGPVQLACGAGRWELTRCRAYCALALALALVLPALTRGGAAAAQSGSAAAEPAAGAVADEARGWLRRADQALARRNYRGVFVHEYGGETETLRVIHRVASDGVSERLVSMDGSGREFIRRGGELSCYLPDQRTVLVVKTAQPTLPLNVPQLDGAWLGPYEVRQLAHTRISGHRARVIAVTPRDAARYGYRVWVDEGSAMPLKTQLRDSHGAVLEQIVFTQLALPTHIADSELRPAVDARKYHWVQQQDASLPAALPIMAASALPLSWQSDALPAGFRMTASGRQALPSGPAEHLVFSDGLASVSVFIQRGHTPRNMRISESATLGTSSVYSTVTSGYRITAVGEVPPQTVRAIAQSFRGGAAEAGEPLGAMSGSEPFPSLDVNGAGALLIIGKLGNGNVGQAGSSADLGLWSRTEPFRASIEPANPSRQTDPMRPVDPSHTAGAPR